ncbi:hypothetical protein BC826DRAFT_1113173 [Russula brevipes]|nr:hypothetical protein BC826DRAFT_1113173 [Russula brevipes]
MPPLVPPSLTALFFTLIFPVFPVGDFSPIIPDGVVRSLITLSSTKNPPLPHPFLAPHALQEMDSLKMSNTDNVIVIGAINRPFDLDDAVLRRLPRRLLVDLPGESECEEILNIPLWDKVLAPEVDLKVLALVAWDTPTFSGLDLKHQLPPLLLLALDAVKENVSVPWVLERSKRPSQDASQTSNADGDGGAQPLGDTAGSASQKCILHPHNFAKALKEIMPSASKSLGTLADLRKWNNEFGEGQK